MPPSDLAVKGQTINDIATRRKHEHSQRLSSISRSNRQKRAEQRRKPNHTDLKEVVERQQYKPSKTGFISDLNEKSKSTPLHPVDMPKDMEPSSSSMKRQPLRNGAQNRRATTVAHKTRTNTNSPVLTINKARAKTVERDIDAEILELSAGIDDIGENKLNVRKIALIMVAAATVCCLLALATSISVDKLDNGQTNFNSVYSN